MLTRRRKSSLEPLPIGVVVQGGQGMVVPRLLSAILRRHSESSIRVLSVLLSYSDRQSGF